MKRFLSILLCGLLLLSCVGCWSSPAREQTPQETPLVTPPAEAWDVFEEAEPTPTVTPTAKPAEKSSAPAATPTPAPVVTPTATPVVTPTVTPVVTTTPAPTPEVTPAPTPPGTSGGFEGTWDVELPEIEF